MNPDKLELLEQVLESDGLPVLMEHIDMITTGFEDKVVRFSVGTENEKEFLFAKLRAEGARQLYVALERNLASMKAKQRK